MKFIVDNLQLVNHAEIVLDGVTVIAAPNGSGKSTISKGLASLASLCRDVSVNVQYRRFEKIIETVRHVYSGMGVDIVFYDDVRELPMEPLTVLFSPRFWDDPENFRKWFVTYFSREADMRSPMGFVYPRDFFPERKHEPRYDQLKEEVLAVLSVSDVQLAKEESRSFMDWVFDGDWASRDYEDQSTRLSIGSGGEETYVELQNKHINKGSQLGTQFFTSVFHVEPYHAIDMNRSMLRSSWRSSPLSVLKGIARCCEWPRTCAIRKEDVLARLAGIARGRIKDTKSGLVYEETFADGKIRKINPHGIASGMKPLAELAWAIEKGAVLPGGLLIIDEPETNLHPEWQVQFADFLVWFSAKCDVKLVLNTHSPYFLRAVDVASRREKCAPNCHYYRMVKCPDGYRMQTDCVDGNLDELFAEMHRPFARLREEVPVVRDVERD